MFRAGINAEVSGAGISWQCGSCGVNFAPRDDLDLNLAVRKLRMNERRKPIHRLQLKQACRSHIPSRLEHQEKIPPVWARKKALIIPIER